MGIVISRSELLKHFTSDQKIEFKLYFAKMSAKSLNIPMLVGVPKVFLNI